MTNSEKIVYHFLKISLRILGLIPRRWAIGISHVLGYLGFHLDKNHRKITIDNLTKAFKQEKSPQEIEKIAGKVFKNLGLLYFELAWSYNQSPKDMRKHFSIKDLHYLNNAYKKQKGVLLLTAHMGNWEMLAYVSEMINFPLNSVFRPNDNVPIDTFTKELRVRFGLKLIPAKRAMRKILTILNQGECITLLMDQSVDWYDGVFVDFFGRRACTSKGLALLALKTQAPVVPVFLIRDGENFRVEFKEEISLIKTGDKTKDIEANTQKYNDVIEACIREFPEQWLWVHNRWKIRPYHPWPRKKE